jgi:hypothetical protein
VTAHGLLSGDPVRAKPRLRRITANIVNRNFLVAIVINSTVKLKGVSSKLKAQSSKAVSKSTIRN